MGKRSSLLSAFVLLAFMLASSAGMRAQDQTRGIQPRPDPADYTVKAVTSSGTFAASQVPADQVRHLFAFDITGSYVVFEVACYPAAGAVQVDPDDFVVKIGTKGELTHQADAGSVAAAVQKQNIPKPPSQAVNVATEANIGYESGRDPYTGQRVHGVYGGAGVGVSNGPDNQPRYPTPGGMPEDRELLQSQLRGRALPAGKFAHPVAGFLYFPRSGVKKDANGNYLLEHFADSADGSSQPSQLPVPARSK